MLNEPVNVPPATTVPVNGTTSVAAGLAASALVTGPDPIRVTNMTRLSSVATNLMTAPSCERSVLARQNTPTPSADAANGRASGVPASLNPASRIMVPRDRPARPRPGTDELRRRRFLAVPAPLVRDVHGLLA